MRSDAIDQLLTTYLEMPAKVSWRGALADSARGIFEGGRLELAGVAVLAALGHMPKELFLRYCMVHLTKRRLPTEAVMRNHQLLSGLV